MGTSKATVVMHLDDTLMNFEDSGVLESMELLGLDGHFTKLKDNLNLLIQVNSRAGSNDLDPVAEEEEYENFANSVLGIADSLDRLIRGISTQSASDSDAISREIASIESDMKECIEMGSRLGLS